MIRITIEMDPRNASLNIRSDAPPPIVFGVVTAAYHELLSAKIREDVKAENRIIEPKPNGGLSL